MVNKYKVIIALVTALGCAGALAGDTAPTRQAYGAAESKWEILANIDMFEVLVNKATVAVELPKEGLNYRSIVAIYSYRKPTNIDAQDMTTQYISDVRKVVFNCDTGRNIVLIRTLWSDERANGTQLARYSYKPSSNWKSPGMPGSILGRLYSIACNNPHYWNNAPANGVSSPSLSNTSSGSNGSNAVESRPFNNAAYCSGGDPACGPKGTWIP